VVLGKHEGKPPEISSSPQERDGYRTRTWVGIGRQDWFGEGYSEASGVIVMANYTAIFEQAEDGTWGGYFPDLAVILVNGTTLEEAKENARTGLEMWIEDMKEQGLPIPPPTVHVMAIEVAA
jgi:predicted RNase H-like HicB family nuclease